MMDSYSSSVRYLRLKKLSEDVIVVLGILSQTCRILQPLDASVFGSIKFRIQQLVHKAATSKKELDAFDTAVILLEEIYLSQTPSNIRGGFKKAGVWVPFIGGPFVDSLEGDITGGSHLLDARKIIRWRPCDWKD